MKYFSIWYNVDGPSKHYAESKKPDKKGNILYEFYLYQISRLKKPTDTEGWLVFASG